LVGEPVVEHVARKANVPSYSMAGQATSPHGVVDPACLDVEIPSGLLRAQESILANVVGEFAVDVASMPVIDRQEAEAANEFARCHRIVGIPPLDERGLPDKKVAEEPMRRR